MNAKSMCYVSDKELQGNATSIGELLHKFRERRGLSLKDIAKKTRIHIGILTNLEKNNLAHLPSKPYVRGFVKALAHLLGIDQRKAIELLEAAYYQLALDQIAAMPPPQEKNENVIVRTFCDFKFPERVPAISKKTISEISITAMVVLGLVFGTQFLNQMNFKRSAPIKKVAREVPPSDAPVERVYKPMASYPPPILSLNFPKTIDTSSTSHF